MSKPQTIIRAKHDKENPYFILRRDTAQDESLSWEARGMLIYLLSKPDDWEIDVKDLQQQCGKGRVYRIINELKEAGYIQDRQKKQNEKTGLWEWTPYIVFETPQHEKIIHIPKTVSRKPEHGYPDTEKREIKQNTDIQNTETKNTKATPIEPSSNSQKLEQPSEQKIPKPQEVLGTVMEKPPVTNSDWALYGKVCKELKQAGIEPSGYSDYVTWVKRLAQTSGGWKVSIPSLISGGRVSDYVATKNKLSKPAAPREKTIQEIGEEYIANTLKAISKKASA